MLFRFVQGIFFEQKTVAILQGTQPGVPPVAHF